VNTATSQPLEPPRRLRVTWLADSSRIAHAHRPGAVRTLCNERVVPEKFAWPQLRNCLACTALVAEAEGRLL
jgi:hypothetical protein